MKGMHVCLWLALAGTVLVSACTPANIRALAKPDPANESTVVVYRGKAFNSGGVDMILGLDGNDVVMMDNSTIATLKLAPGNHDLFVRSNQADKPFHFPTVLQPGQTLCLEGKPSAANFSKALVPFLYFATSTFELGAVPCLSDDAAQAYTVALVPYQP